MYSYIHSLQENTYHMIDAVGGRLMDLRFHGNRPRITAPGCLEMIGGDSSYSSAETVADADCNATQRVKGVVI